MKALLLVLFCVILPLEAQTPPAPPADRQRIVGPLTFTWPVRSLPCGVPTSPAR